VVLGISTDDVKAHARFRAKRALPYRLLADVDHAVAEKYGVWREKTLFGHRFMGVVRTTFLIDRTGRVARVFENVRSARHGPEVAAALAALG
jgi:thioredoxin-dependent peroxiredoxin